MSCAPHAYVPILLSDLIDDESDLALSFGKELLSVTDEILVCGRKLIGGMLGEIKKAVELEMPITVFDADLCSEISKRVEGTQIQFYHTPLPLAFSAEELFTIGEG